jgi:hypothetical protein
VAVLCVAADGLVLLNWVCALPFLCPLQVLRFLRRSLRLSDGPCHILYTLYLDRYTKHDHKMPDLHKPFMT